MLLSIYDFGNFVWNSSKKIATEIRGDNLSVIRAVQSLSNHITREKRFQSIITTVQQVVEKDEIDQFIWAPTAVNLADGLTKATSSTNIIDLLVFGDLRATEEEILTYKHFKTHTNKQYLVGPDLFVEIGGNKKKRKRKKPVIQD